MAGSAMMNSLRRTVKSQVREKKTRKIQEAFKNQRHSRSSLFGGSASKTARNYNARQMLLRADASISDDPAIRRGNRCMTKKMLRGMSDTEAFDACGYTYSYTGGKGRSTKGSHKRAGIKGL